MCSQPWGPGCPKSQIDENVQQVGEKVRRAREKRLRQRRVRILAADGTHVRVQGQDTVVLQWSDGEREWTLPLEVLEGEDPGEPAAGDGRGSAGCWGRAFAE
jgi:hypothetical protein